MRQNIFKRDMLNTVPPNSLPLNTLVDINNDTYHTTQGVSSSALKVAKKSALAYYHAYVNPNTERKVPTRDMVRGSFFHTLTMEGDKLPDEYVIKQVFNNRTKDGKAAKEAWERYTEGKIAVTQSDYDMVRGMRDAVYAHAVLGSLMADGLAEKSLYAIDHETKLLLKVRPDWLPRKAENVIIDLKSCVDASDDAFGRHAAALDYPMSAAHYLDLLPWADVFIFAAVEKEAPYHINLLCVERDSHEHEMARHMNRQAMRRIADGYLYGQWPGYDHHIKGLQVPGYYWK